MAKYSKTCSLIKIRIKISMNMRKIKVFIGIKENKSSNEAPKTREVMIALIIPRRRTKPVVSSFSLVKRYAISIKQIKTDICARISSILI
jgi:hypothetical protein